MLASLLRQEEIILFRYLESLKTFLAYLFTTILCTGSLLKIAVRDARTLLTW